MTLRALFFDVDGTLAETEELHRRAFNQTFAAQGLDWNWDQPTYARLLAITGGKERIAHFLTARGDEPAAHDIAALHRAKTDRYAALMAAGGVVLCDGIAELIDEARAAGLRLAIATTTSPGNVEALIRATMGVAPEAVFDVVAAGDEVRAKKPAPDVYDRARARLGIPAAEAIALEDSRNGLLAARAAGIACVVVRSTYTRHDAFPGDAVIVDSFATAGGVRGLARLMGMAA